jgi:hypothetical protein
MKNCPKGMNRCRYTQKCVSRIPENNANKTRCQKGFRKCVDNICYKEKGASALQKLSHVDDQPKKNHTGKKVRAKKLSDEKSVRAFKKLSDVVYEPNKFLTTREKSVHAFKKLSDVINEPNKLSKFLKNVCNDADSCLTFGRYVTLIKKLLENFTNFAYTINELKRIGAPSKNGFIYEISYKRFSFTGQAIFKFARRGPDPKDVPDNLFYEYLVGYHFINKYNLRFPCFLETYGLFYVDDQTHRYMETIPTGEVSTSIIKSKLKHLSNDTDAERDDNFQLSCKKPSNICILIQHLRVKGSLKTYFENFSSNPSFFNYVLPQLLFQVYAPLTRLVNNFTHYDLHTDNVLIYDLGNTNYIQMNYIFQGNDTISFKTNYIVKIIDYGRCYFHVNNDLNSETIFRNICDICQPNCGVDKGYYWLTKRPRKRDYIFSTERNASHDLRLMKIIRDKSAHLPETPFKKLLKKCVYNYNYGTRENDKKMPGFIVNTPDAFQSLLRYIKYDLAIQFQQQNELQFQGKTNVGTLNIYMDQDRNMDFV